MFECLGVLYRREMYGDILDVFGVDSSRCVDVARRHGCHVKVMGGRRALSSRMRPVRRQPMRHNITHQFDMVFVPWTIVVKQSLDIICYI